MGGSLLRKEVGGFMVLRRKKAPVEDELLLCLFLDNPPKRCFSVKRSEIFNRGWNEGVS